MITATPVKERPIIFSGPMVRAIRDGRKTQTRRVVKPQQAHESGAVWIRNGEFHAQCRDELSRGVQDAVAAPIRCPFGQPGDRLWVRETWCPVDDGEGNEWIDYRATPWDSADAPAGWHNAPGDPEALKWRPSIHMPRAASRLTLEITGVRVERLQDISVDDVAAEGIDLEGEHAEDFAAAEQANSAGLSTGCRLPEIYPFKALWDSINAKRAHGWDTNPWAWVIEFKQVIT